MNIKQYSILIADDDQSNRRTIKELLSKAGFTIFEAENGRQAVEIISEKKVHISILDVEMPKLSGIEVIKTLKSLNAAVPSVLITGGICDHIMKNAFNVGAFTLLHKPLNAEALKIIIDKIITKYYES